jgi:primosomal protein N' (replication factor Y)
VLSSATPSVESYYLTQNGRYSLNTLKTRYGAAQLPDVTVIDMNLEQENGNNTILSRELLDALNNNLENHKQSIVLLNRRGYNTFVSCKACGQVITCPNCSISLTYHSANQRLMCHYCGYSVPFTKECPACHENKVHYSGHGTQRAEEQLQELLPGARILRLDTDSTLTRFAYEKKMGQFAEGEYDIIIGTQMVAKGLDFENVTLVGVLSADQALYGDDFRSYERAFDLLTQVLGVPAAVSIRAGQSSKPILLKTK